MKAVNIVLWKDGNGPDWHYVDIEDDNGNSMKFGKWVPGKTNKEFKIRITEQDFRDMNG